MSERHDKNPVSGLSFGYTHPLVSTPFADAVSQPSSFLEPIRQKAEQELDAFRQLAKGAGIAGEATTIAGASGGGRLVYSKETTAKLRSTKWKTPIDSATGLQRAEARDGAGRIRETAKFEPAERDKLATATKGVVAVAHVISSIDTQLQLEKINEKLDALSNFLEAERHGELRGVYASLQKALALRDAGARERALEHCSRALDDLQGRFFATAQAKLRDIRHPADISPLKAIMSRQKTATRELRQALTEAMSDLRLSEFCNQLNAVLHVELGHEEILASNRQSLLENYRELAPLATEKLSYLDEQLVEAVRTKLAVLTLKVDPAEFQVVRGEHSPAEEGDKLDVN